MKLKICGESEIPVGGSKVIRILARRVAVFNLDGTLYAIEADCKHMKANLASVELNGTVITCPLHGWRYDIPTGECLEEKWAALKTFPVFVENGYIWVDV